MNKVILVGNLTKDPEMTTTASGKSICRFTIAVQRRYTNENGEREADFLNIVTFNTQAENCYKYLEKGRKCGVVGSIQTRTYEAQDGSKRYATEIMAEEVEFLGSKPEEENGGSKTSGKNDTMKFEPIEDSNLPF